MSSPLPRSCSSRQEFSASPPPSASHAPNSAVFKWAESLHNLLDDDEGVKLFLEFLISEEHHHAHALQFYFACEGLKTKHEPEEIHKLAKLIYKTYISKSSLPIDDVLRRDIIAKLKSGSSLHALGPPVTLFDEAQKQIFDLINGTTYQNFFKSDIYLNYVESGHLPTSDVLLSPLDMPAGGSNVPTSCTPVSIRMPPAYAINRNKEWNIDSPLQTLHEDIELTINAQNSFVGTPGSTGHQTPLSSVGAGGAITNQIALTKDSLRMSQKYRMLDIRPKSEAFAGFSMNRSGGVHISYNSYNPVSRQDSEMQSLSSQSDLRTESDTKSIADSLYEDIRELQKSTDVSSFRSTHHHHHHHHHHQQPRRHHDSASTISLQPSTEESNHKSADRSNLEEINQSASEHLVSNQYRHRHHHHSSRSEANNRFIAHLNVDTSLNRVPQPFNNIKENIDLKKHAALLKQRLEALVMDQQGQESFDRKLKEISHGVTSEVNEIDLLQQLPKSPSLPSGGGSVLIQGDNVPCGIIQPPPSFSQPTVTGASAPCGIDGKELERAIREKIQYHHDSDQDILDEHVSRVFADTLSPVMMTSSRRSMSPVRTRSLHRSRRKGKDVLSTVSGDSGTGHDFADLASSSGNQRLSLSRRTLFTDSGISAVSESTIAPHEIDNQSLTLEMDTNTTGACSSDCLANSSANAARVMLTSSSNPISSGINNTCQSTDRSRVTAWLLESSENKCLSNSGAHSDMAMRPSGRSSGRACSGTLSSTTTVMGAARRQAGVTCRSSSLERVPTMMMVASASGNCAMDVDGRNPMAVLLQHQTKIDADARLSRARQSTSSGIKYVGANAIPANEVTQSFQSSLRRMSKRQQQRYPPPLTTNQPNAVSTIPSACEEVVTKAVIAFHDQKIPYFMKIPGCQISLRQFKEFLPKKGNYRYYFKTVCEDWDNQVALEEVTSDAEVLPLFNGQIVAQVMPVE